MREYNGRVSPFRYKLTKHPATSCRTLHAPHVNKLISHLLNVVQSLADSIFDSTIRICMVSNWALHQVSPPYRGRCAFEQHDREGIFAFPLIALKLRPLATTYRSLQLLQQLKAVNRIDPSVASGVPDQQLELCNPNIERQSLLFVYESHCRIHYSACGTNCYVGPT